MCNCIADFNAQMEPHNGGLVTTMFGKPERCCVETYPLKTGRGVKKPPKAIASFCPFCGEEYAKAKGSDQ